MKFGEDNQAALKGGNALQPTRHGHVDPAGRVR